MQALDLNLWDHLSCESISTLLKVKCKIERKIVYKMKMSIRENKTEESLRETER